MEMETGTGRTIVGKVVPGSLRTHLFLTVLIVAVLVGGLLRFVPASSATPAGGEGAPGSTACAAQ
jgi:hypothetical protein